MAKVGLGERGAVWWGDGSPDLNRRPRMTEADELGLSTHAFDRQDEGENLGFYAPPRLATHIDEGAVEALAGFVATQSPQADGCST